MTYLSPYSKIVHYAPILGPVGLTAGSQMVVNHDVGSVSDFPSGTCRIIEVGEHEVGVYNLDGQYYAIRNYCPHRGAPVCKGELRGTMLPSEPGQYEYGLEGRVLFCPWHHWEFDVTTGRTVFATDKRRLITYPVHQDNGRIIVETLDRSGGGSSTEAEPSPASVGQDGE